MMKKMMTSLAMLAFLGFGASQLLAGTNWTSCEINCFENYDDCFGNLPGYKCEQIYNTCMRGCN